LIASTEADKAYWLLTDDTLRAMYHAARAAEGNQSFHVLAPLHLPSSIAKTVMSGKYSEHKDPGSALAEMVRLLETRKKMVEQLNLQKKLEAAKRGTSNPELTRLEAQLGVARRIGNQELVDRLEGEIASNRKQAELNGEVPDDDKG
jgi:hypothetical protein